MEKLRHQCRGGSRMLALKAEMSEKAYVSVNALTVFYPNHKRSLHMFMR